MALNKNALIRYKTIDQCLQNRFRKWTLNDLIQACSDALYEYEGKDVNVSRRTVQLDIQLMRSDKLGYNAPIIVYDKKYYTYEDTNYSITNIPLTETDMQVLSETVEMLKQFKDFSFFSELGGIVQRLEDKVNTEQHQRPAIIHLEKNEHLKGLHFLDIIYQSILKKIALEVTYQSFSARTASVFVFHAFILKEFNNRWFAVGKKSADSPVLTLALDRVKAIKPALKVDYLDLTFDANDFYKDTYGVTVLNDRNLKTIKLKIDRKNAPYVKTKPFHRSQEIIEEYKDGSILINIRVHLNFELERLILGFGEAMTVIEPKALRKRIRNKLKYALAHYED